MRGYTGHEHLKWFGLINMNGRMYDAGLCRFLSPDPYVQMPDYTQNFNRYSYCLNNPLIYTDPSGEFFAFPTFSWSKNDGFSVGLTVGIGLPGAANLSYNASYNFKHDQITHTVGATFMFNNVYASYSNSSGWSTGYSLGLSLTNSPVSTNFLSTGMSYNWNEDNWNIHVSAWNYNVHDGWDFNPSISARPVSYKSNDGFSYLGQDIVNSYNKELGDDGVNYLFEVLNGLTKVDNAKSTAQQAWQLTSRFTWELLQTYVGLSMALSLSEVASEVSYHKGITFIGHSALPYGGLSMGTYSFIGNKANSLRSHEFGHNVQSRMLGPAYIPVAGVGSLSAFVYNGVMNIAKGGVYGNYFYDKFLTERWAYKLGEIYY